MDRLETSVGDRLEIIRVNIFSAAGRDLAAEYANRFTPTFVFLDGAGDEIWRSVGTVDPDQVKASLEKLLQ